MEPNGNSCWDSRGQSTSVSIWTLVWPIIKIARTDIQHTKMTTQKVAIITGGSSGIGRATAVALAKEAVKVTVAARRAKEGKETVGLVKEAGSDGIFVKTDVANENDVRSLVEKTIKIYGKLDLIMLGQRKR